MGSWVLRWNFDRESYRPKDSPIASFWLENKGDTELYLSDLNLKFDFGSYDLKSISGIVPPKSEHYLGNVRLSLPKNAVGRNIFTLNYRIYEYSAKDWIDQGYYRSDGKYFLSVYPQPFYKVFISRGLSTEDRTIGDPIAEMVREWGFETVTVGIEEEADDEKVAEKAKKEIRYADGLIAIATPRIKDALTGLWKAMEWLHGEVGIAFGEDRPLLILKDERVSLGGLPSYLAKYEETPTIEFSRYNLDELRKALPTVMPGFREWIENKRRQEFVEGLRKIITLGLAAVGGATIVSGVIGILTDTSKK